MAKEREPWWFSDNVKSLLESKGIQHTTGLFDDDNRIKKMIEIIGDQSPWVITSGTFPDPKEGHWNDNSSKFFEVGYKSPPSPEPIKKFNEWMCKETGKRLAPDIINASENYAEPFPDEKTIDLVRHGMFPLQREISPGFNTPFCDETRRFEFEPVKVTDEMIDRLKNAIDQTMGNKKRDKRQSVEALCSYFDDGTNDRLGFHYFHLLANGNQTVGDVEKILEKALPDTNDKPDKCVVF